MTFYSPRIRVLLKNIAVRFKSDKCASGDKKAPNKKQQPEHKPGASKIYRNLSLFVCLPAIIAAAVNVYLQKQKETHERPPFVAYPYLRLRSKRFPWGDGTRSLFHNPCVNPLPDGYEDDPKCEHYTTTE